MPEENQYTHLKPEIRKLLELDDEERIYSIRSPLWVGYSAAQKILKKMDVLIKHPPKDRMPNMLLVGDTNNGKTTIVKRFISKYPEQKDEDTGRKVTPILYVQVPGVPNEARLYDTILQKLFAPHKDRETITSKVEKVLTILKNIQTKIIIFDELHNILVADKRRQRGFLNAIKFLANELKIPIIGAGTQEAFNAIRTDEQLLNRFIPYQLPKWKMGNEYLRLLLSFEQLVPLKKQSHLTHPDIANKILGMSEGVIGEISTIITEAAVLAIEKKTEKIDLKILKSIDYLTPSERRTKKSNL